MLTEKWEGKAKQQKRKQHTHPKERSPGTIRIEVSELRGFGQAFIESSWRTFLILC